MPEEHRRKARRSSAPAISAYLNNYITNCQESDREINRYRRYSFMNLCGNYFVHNVQERESLLGLVSQSDSSVEIDTSSYSCGFHNQNNGHEARSGSYEILCETTQNSDDVQLNFKSYLRTFCKKFLLGQILSILFGAMSISNYYLSSSHIYVPTGQNLIRYILFCIICTTRLAFRSNDGNLLMVLKSRGWKYLLLAAADLEANTLVMMAQKFTTLTNIQLLDGTVIPMTLVLAVLLQKIRFCMVHIVAATIASLGVLCLLWTHIKDDGNPPTGGNSNLIGDLMFLGGSFLFAIVAFAEEYLIKIYDWVEYLGMISLFGSFLGGLQTLILERSMIALIQWNSNHIAVLLLIYGLAQFMFHLFVPLMLRGSGASAMKLSLLTAYFYLSAVQVILLQSKIQFLYLTSFVLILVGIITFLVKPVQQAANFRLVNCDVNHLMLSLIHNLNFIFISFFQFY